MNSKSLPSATRPAPKLGRRERNKADKLRRIKIAARRLFTKKGYEATSTKEIAEAAGVSVGALFFYARDKADVCCLMAIDRIHELFSTGLKSVDDAAPLLDQLIGLFSPLFVDAARHPSLSRILIKEMMLYREKPNVDAWVTSRVGKLLVAAQRRGEIQLHVAPAFVARAINQLYLAEMRDWIVGEKPKPTKGLADLRRSLDLLLTGLKHDPRYEDRESANTGEFDGVPANS